MKTLTEFLNEDLLNEDKDLLSSYKNQPDIYAKILIDNAKEEGIDITKPQNGYKFKIKLSNENRRREVFFELVNLLIEIRGKNADLNDIDTSNITAMNYLFKGKDFNGDISKWDMRKVEMMNNMFEGSTFNGDISQWKLSKKLWNMESMFENSDFNGDITGWKVDETVIMTDMFLHSPLAKNPPAWYKE